MPSLQAMASVVNLIKEEKYVMERREFLSKTGCGIASLLATPLILTANQNEDPPKRRKYKIEIEIFEAREDSQCHKKGDKFTYPDDMGKICPWLLTSMHDFIRLLKNPFRSG